MATIAPRFKEGGERRLPAATELPGSSKIVVAGAGVFGSWAALNLLRLGYKVSLFDPWGPGNSLSSSGGETRLMRSVYGGNSFYTALAMESYDIWEATGKQINRRLLLPTGNLWLAGADDTELRLAIPVMEGLGLAYQRLTPDEAAARYPWLNTEGLAYVILEEKTGVLKARESCQAVVELFVREGGEYVQELLEPGTVRGEKMVGVVRPGGGEVSADLFLFAGGPWLKGLFAEVLGSLLTVTRQEVYYFGLPAAIAGKLETGVPTWIDMSEEGGYYGIPGGLHRGFKIASDRRGPAIDPSLAERTPTAAEVERARRYIGRRFRGLGSLPLLEHRVCQYTNTPDGSFILDRHPEAGNVWMLGGGSGHGFKHGPALGALCAGVVTGKKGLPYLLSLDRFRNKA